ncbi:hypothetical protein N8I74_18830 [Chitiniphilus purpureus]|uniref:Uncharacterized protein n=1 Tax=Chitiniphilus purpureus TaxID=2981137 RepID=A0ABY6DPC9_9NEIS|nr:hypothetical protein [Chitiniphilus sp. CD1]UXY15341.1 hypothetical protein N8I74_18830 [Chitiniphilus sp. CD1]
MSVTTAVVSIAMKTQAIMTHQIKAVILTTAQKAPFLKIMKNYGKNSRPGSDGNRWTKLGEGKRVEYHRFQNDGNGNWHWNGSTNGRTSNGMPRNISSNNIPKDVKAW